MTVYHGSVAEVRTPDLSRSKACIDFGPGFYVTTLRQQAERWALRKAARTDGVAVVNVYNYWSTTATPTFLIDALKVQPLDFSSIDITQSMLESYSRRIRAS